VLTGLHSQNPMPMKKLSWLLLFFFSNITILLAQEIVTRGTVSGTRYSNVPYKSGSNLSTYERDRCKLDIYIPRTAGTAPFPVVVYFHGGGLNSGDKSEGWADWSNNFGFKFLENGVAMVMVNYRLSGQQGTKWPAYIQDAAAAVAWVSNNIQNYGGDQNKVFVMGFSAGAYLTHMLSIDSRWYTEINFDRNRIKGYLPISGQTRAHGTVASDLGIPSDQLMTQRPDAMPMGHVKKTEKPLHIFVGEYEGQTITDNYNYYNQLLSRGSTDLLIYTNPGKDHGGMRDGLGDASSPTRTRILDFIWTYSSCTTINLPGTLQGEAYCSSNGISTEPTADTGGGRNLSSIETNDWAGYKINVPVAGAYIVNYRVASLNGGGSLRLEKLGGGTVYGTIAIPKTSGWQNWTTVSQTIQLPAGSLDIALVGATGGFNVNWISFGTHSVNIAYNKPVAVTSIQGTGYEGSKAVDANGTTRWASATANNQNFVVDLGGNFTINRIRIAWEAAYARDYQIQVSTNNSTWTTIQEFWGKSSSVADDYTGLDATARWLKVYCINRATQYGFSIFEFEVYGTSAGARITAHDASTETPFELDQMVLYPNPTTGKVNIKITEDFINGEISLVDLNGQVLTHEKVISTSHCIDLQSLARGTYLLQLQGKFSRKQIKVLKE
jgi:dienelactone hydrolase